MSRAPHRWVLAVLAWGMGLWLLCWQMWLGGGWWMGLGALLLSSPKRWVKVLYPVLGLLLIPLCLLRYSQGVDRMMAKVERGPQALGLHDRLALYGLNGAMGVAGGLLGAPEASVETLLLMVPSSGERVWESRRFPFCAPRVAAVAQLQQKRAQAGSTHFTPQDVQWQIGEGGTSVRAGLALNTLVVNTLLVDAEQGQALQVESVVEVDYLPHASLPLLRLGPVNVRVEQDLFHALEELGWLHPYALHYQTQIGVEERLPGVCEAWSVRLVQLVGQ